MYIHDKQVEKVVVLRIVVGDLVLNQNLNMALSQYGLNLKELKARLDALTEEFPRGLYFNFHFILYKNNTYDIIAKGPTLASCLSSVLGIENSSDERNVNYEQIIIGNKLKELYNDMLKTTFFKDYPEWTSPDYKGIIGTTDSFKTP